MFDFVPQILIINQLVPADGYWKFDGGIFMTHGRTNTELDTYTNTSTESGRVFFLVNWYTIKWWTNYNSSANVNQRIQLNTENSTYYYTAIG